MQSVKHVSAVKESRVGGPSQLQSSIATCFSSVEKKKKVAEHFGKRIAETFIKANIPLSKLENEHVKSFFNEFVEGKLGYI